MSNFRFRWSNIFDKSENLSKHCVNNFPLFLQVLNTTVQNVTVVDNTQFLASDGNVPNVSVTICAVFGKYFFTYLNLTRFYFLRKRKLMRLLSLFQLQQRQT